VKEPESLLKALPESKEGSILALAKYILEEFFRKKSGTVKNAWDNFLYEKFEFL